METIEILSFTIEFCYPVKVILREFVYKTVTNVIELRSVK